MTEISQSRRELIRTGALGAGAMLWGKPPGVGRRQRPRARRGRRHPRHGPEPHQGLLRAAERRGRRAVRRRREPLPGSGREALRQGGKASGRRPTPTSASSTRTRRSTPSRSSRRTTGTRWPRSGRSRPASMSRVEKPCCHNVFEGQKLVEAAAKVQGARPGRRRAAQQSLRADDGEVPRGAAASARSTWPRASATSGATPSATTTDEPVPPGVHYDLWLGPAPTRPFNRNRFHYNWHWNWDYGNGDIGNQGVHEMDVARWGLGVTLPTQVCAMGGALHVRRRPADAQRADGDLRVPEPERRRRQEEDPPVRGPRLDHEQRGRAVDAQKARHGRLHGHQRRQHRRQPVLRLQGLHGQERRRVADLPGREARAGPDRQAARATTTRASSTPSASADPATFNRSIEEGFYSCALVHLGNISYRLGRSLEFDPATMRFPRDEEANAMLTREYRAPFVVPDRV